MVVHGPSPCKSLQVNERANLSYETNNKSLCQLWETFRQSVCCCPEKKFTEEILKEKGHQLFKYVNNWASETERYILTQTELNRHRLIVLLLSHTSSESLSLAQSLPSSVQIMTAHAHRILVAVLYHLQLCFRNACTGKFDIIQVTNVIRAQNSQVLNLLVLFHAAPPSVPHNICN